MAKDINKKVFEDSTKLKLDIFAECFEEWLPVFNNDIYTTAIYVFDFFAGSGRDVENNPGSPLVLLNKAKGVDRKYCMNAKKPIHFLFNENLINKSKILTENLLHYIQKCESENECEGCIYQYKVENYEFQNIFSNQGISNIFKDPDLGKFVLLDQYGFSQIDERVFLQLISYPKTDFIFFISSSFISRFREHQNTKKYIDTSRIEFDKIRPNEIHRAVATYFRDLIPFGKEYYLHHFSIRKEEKKGNYYGLIFGTNHTFGMEKFLKVCWRHDVFSGEANYNIDNNYERGTIFYNSENNVKKELVSEEIKKLVLSGEISDNISGLKYCLQKGCKPDLFTEVIKQLEKEKKIERFGYVNNQSSAIHKAKTYNIKRTDYGT